MAQQKTEQWLIYNGLSKNKPDHTPIITVRRAKRIKGRHWKIRQRNMHHLHHKSYTICLNAPYS